MNGIDMHKAFVLGVALIAALACLYHQWRRDFRGYIEW